MPTTTKPLVELCEPLFSYICRLNRAARLGTPAFEASQVRGDIDGILRSISEEADDAGQTEQFARIRRPLVYFVDFMVASSSFEWAPNYPRIANDENEYAGDERFFHPLANEHNGDTLDETLADNSSDATERLAVFYECLGLGFSGMYNGDAEEKQEQIKDYINRCAARIRDRMDADETARICPEAYKHTNREVLYEPVKDKLGAVSIIAIGALVVVFIVSGLIYQFQTSQARKLMTDFTQWASKQ
jgi:hypothetical protein